MFIFLITGPGEMAWLRKLGKYGISAHGLT